MLAVDLVVCELNRFFMRQQIALDGRVVFQDVADDGRESGGLARSGSSGDVDQPALWDAIAHKRLWQPDFVERYWLVWDRAQHDLARRATWVENRGNVDAVAVAQLCATGVSLSWREKLVPSIDRDS